MIVCVSLAFDVHAGVRDRIVEVVKDVVLVRETIEDARRAEDSKMLRARSLDQDGDAAPLERRDDASQHLCARRVDHPELRQPEDQCRTLRTSVANSTRRPLASRATSTDSHGSVARTLPGDGVTSNLNR